MEPNWHHNTMLGGVVGSTAYGLAGPDSDRDYLGVYVADFAEVAGLNPPLGKQDASLVSKDPDCTQHEVLKFCHLALGCNPTVLELLWLSEYDVTSHWGDSLLAVKQSFLSARAVRNSYMGYATQQFSQLEKRGDGSFSSTLRKRTEKHARHMLRLLHQGVQLYTSGELRLKLVDPERYHQFGRDVAEGRLDKAQDELRAAEYLLNRVKSPLADQPNREQVETWLRELRLHTVPYRDQAPMA